MRRQRCGGEGESQELGLEKTEISPVTENTQRTGMRQITVLLSPPKFQRVMLSESLCHSGSRIFQHFRAEGQRTHHPLSVQVRILRPREKKQCPRVPLQATGTACRKRGPFSTTQPCRPPHPWTAGSEAVLPRTQEMEEEVPRYFYGNSHDHRIPEFLISTWLLNGGVGRPGCLTSVLQSCRSPLSGSCSG